MSYEDLLFVCKLILMFLNISSCSAMKCRLVLELQDIRSIVQGFTFCIQTDSDEF